MNTDPREAMRRIESLVASIERSPHAEARDQARALLRAVLDLHGAGLARVLEIAAAKGEAGRAIAADLARDPLTASLLLLHGAHPVPLAGRAKEALERLGPRLAGLGAALASVDVRADASVRVALRPSDGGPRWASAASGERLRAVVTEALLEAAPDAASIEVEGLPVEAPAGFVPLERVRGARSAPRKEE